MFKCVAVSDTTAFGAFAAYQDNILDWGDVAVNATSFDRSSVFYCPPNFNWTCDCYRA